jgi:DNA-binding response OmpR family regulator
MANKARLVVMVIDDEPDVLATICDLLRAHGFDVLLPAAPLDAEEIARMKFNVLLTDLVLTDLRIANTPEITGYDVIRAVRQRQPEVPIIAISGKGTYMPEKLGREIIGADRFLAKPLRSDELRDAIMSVLAARGGGEAHAG